MEPKPRLLLIDDDPLLLEMVRSALTEYSVVTAASGEEGLKLYAEQPFDAVLCDIGLPDMNGFDVVHHIREIHPNSRILIITGQEREENLIASLREKIVDFLAKPFELEELRGAIAGVLASEEDIEVVSAMPEWIELRIPASFQLASRLSKFFEQLHAAIDTITRQSISTAFRELLNNAIEHGCGGDARRRISICYLRLSRVILYRINDPGGGFDRSRLKHAAIGNPEHDPLSHVEVREAQGLRPGGFGILCAEGIADELIYNERGNEVIFCRYLNGEVKD